MATSMFKLILVHRFSHEKPLDSLEDLCIKGNVWPSPLNFKAVTSEFASVAIRAS